MFPYSSAYIIILRKQDAEHSWKCYILCIKKAPALGAHKVSTSMRYDAKQLLYCLVISVLSYCSKVFSKILFILG